jgi:LPS O-antigen subunit length determinant protein (WzzB/FepE family)
MKKITLSIALFVIISLLLVMGVSANDATTEIIATEPTIETVEETLEVIPENENLDGDELTEQFLKYIMSGEEGASEVMDKIILIGEQYKAAKEEGYTFKDRMVQMFTTENLVTLSAAGFLVICGIAFFVIEAKRKKDRLMTSTYLARLEQKYTKEVESNLEMKKAIDAQALEIQSMKESLDQLCKDSADNHLDLETETRCIQAVATMIKDVFLNSKTIDANAKSLLIHNYLTAVDPDKEGEENE